MPFQKYAKIMHYEEESHCLKSEPRTAASGPGEKKKFSGPSKGGPSKNLHTDSEQLSFSVAWAWSGEG